MAIALPYTFDTSDVWRKILRGAFSLTLFLGACMLITLVTGYWAKAASLAVCTAVVFFFSRQFLRFQTGSVGTLTADRIVIEPNRVLWFSLPGPAGTYTLDRFSAVRVEYNSGPVQPGVQGGPNEIVWLVGKPGTPNIAIARTDDRAGRVVGQEFGLLLALPVEELNAPKVIAL